MLRRQNSPALRAARTDHGAATTRFHAGSKAVGTSPAYFRGLESAFHGYCPMSIDLEIKVYCQTAKQNPSTAVLLVGNPTLHLFFMRTVNGLRVKYQTRRTSFSPPTILSVVNCPDSRRYSLTRLLPTKKARVTRISLLARG